MEIDKRRRCYAAAVADRGTAIGMDTEQCPAGLADAGYADHYDVW